MSLGIVATNFKFLTPRKTKQMWSMSLKQLTLVSCYTEEATTSGSCCYTQLTNLLTNAGPKHPSGSRTLPRSTQSNGGYPQNSLTLFISKTESDSGWLKTQTFTGLIHLERLQCQNRKQALVDLLLVKYRRTFSRLRGEIGIRNKFKITVSCKNDEPVFAENWPTKTNRSIHQAPVEWALPAAVV